MAKRRTNQEWRTLFERYESSQLSQRLFCERNGLSLSTFYAKCQQLKHIEKPNTVGFVKAVIPQPISELKQCDPVIVYKC
nr:hypothetical protein [Vibrio cidicii]